MNLLVLLIVLLFVFGGGGAYLGNWHNVSPGGPIGYGGGLIGLVLLLVILRVFGVI